MSEILIKRDSTNSLANEEFSNEILAKIKEFLKLKVEELYLFGSVARKEAHIDSDLDLIIIPTKETIDLHKEQFDSLIERPFIFKELKKIYPDTDIIVYSKSEFDKIKANPETQFHQNILKEMVRVI